MTFNLGSYKSPVSNAAQRIPGTQLPATPECMDERPAWRTPVACLPAVTATAQACRLGARDRNLADPFCELLYGNQGEELLRRSVLELSLVAPHLARRTGEDLGATATVAVCQSERASSALRTKSLVQFYFGDWCSSFYPQTPD